MPTNLPASERAAERALILIHAWEMEADCTPLANLKEATAEVAAIISSEFAELIRLGKALRDTLESTERMYIDGPCWCPRSTSNSTEPHTAYCRKMKGDLQAFCAELRRVGGAK